LQSEIERMSNKMYIFTYYSRRDTL